MFHSDFDNFDQFVNDLSCAGSVHTANGIMLQDFEEVDLPSNAGGELKDIPSVKRTKRECLDLEFGSELPDCYVTNRKSPNFMIVRRVDPNGKKLMLESSRPNMAVDKKDQEVPGWAGFYLQPGESQNV